MIPAYASPDVTRTAPGTISINNPSTGILIQVIIGANALTPTKVLFSHFGGEATLSLTLPFGLFPNMTLLGQNEQAVATTANSQVGIKVQPTAPKEEFNDFGGLDLIFTFLSKPSTSTWTFKMADNQGITSILNPPLTLACSPSVTAVSADGTAAYDIHGRLIVSRPIHVVNSIAFYFDKQGDYTAFGGKWYGCGKFGHLYRLKATDSINNSAWFDWSLSGNNPVLTDTTGFLNTAIYPVILAPVGDTFGFSGNGASAYGSDTDIFAGSIFPGSAGTVTKLSVYCRNYQAANNPQCKGVITDSSGIIIANGITNAIAIANNAALAWYDLTFPVNPTTSAANYVLGAIFYYYHDFRFDGGDANQGWIDTTNNFTTPTNPSDAALNTNKFSIYATYTPAASVGAMQMVINFDMKLTTLVFQK
jgi:hypothetical protein